MSFSSEVKEELSRLENHERHCTVAELSAIIRLCGKVVTDTSGRGSILLHTENVAVARRFYLLIRSLSSIRPEVAVRRHEYLKKNRYYVISIQGHEVISLLKMTGIVNNLGQIDEEEPGPGFGLLQNTCCRRAYLRGAFLAAGSLTDPEKNYHFEIVCPSLDKAAVIRDLYLYFGLEARIVARKKYYVVYMKEGAAISDAMNVMEAHKCMMRFENIRILKDVRNTVNRRVNCEAANISKTVSAAHKQIEDIRYIKDTVGLDRLPENLRDMAYARLEEPGISLKELGTRLNRPIGKSGVNHRLRKLSEIAQNIRETGQACL